VGSGRAGADFPVNLVAEGSDAGGSAGSFGLLEAAAEQALSGAGMATAGSLQNCDLILGCANPNYLAEAQYRRARIEGSEAAPPDAYAMLCGLAARHGITGSVTSVHTACSSSAVALILGRERILRGDARRVLVLGAEGLNEIVLRGFLSLLLLDPEGCRPFDAERRGLQLGEGFAALLLEGDDVRDAHSPRLLGGANLCDTHHLTSASPDGSGMHAVMRAALEDAEVEARDIVAVKAHGTGSPDNDAAEAAAMRRTFTGVTPPTTSLKRSLGHTLGACGALETVALLGCLRDGFLPAAAGFTQVDAELGFLPLREPADARSGAYLLDFFGFGGNYASLVLRHG
jgi:3-oxoacyl-(acyl-carrier-protein) synthase